MPNDVDIISKGESDKPDDHFFEISKYLPYINERKKINGYDNHFIAGFNFIDLKIIRELKIARAEPKDKIDLEVIRKFFTGSKPQRVTLIIQKALTVQSRFRIRFRQHVSVGLDKIGLLAFAKKTRDKIGGRPK